jgi:hypothetical protein
VLPSPIAPSQARAARDSRGQNRKEEADSRHRSRPAPLSSEEAALTPASSAGRAISTSRFGWCSSLDSV